MTAPPVLFASCIASKWSSGQVEVTDGGIALRLNQYENWSWSGRNRPGRPDHRGLAHDGG